MHRWPLIFLVSCFHVMCGVTLCAVERKEVPQMSGGSSFNGEIHSSVEDSFRLGQIPTVLDNLSLKQLLDFLQNIDLLADESALEKASHILNALVRHCYCNGEIKDLLPRLEMISESWQEIDAGADPVMQHFLYEMSGISEYVSFVAKAQVYLGQRLEQLGENSDKSMILLFEVAGFNPEMRPMTSSLADQIIRSTLPVCKNLLPYDKPRPFNLSWTPDDYPWQEVALENMKHGKLFIVFVLNEPVIYFIMFENELWIGPCNTEYNPVAFSFGPNPDCDLIDSLSRLFEEKGYQRTGHLAPGDKPLDDDKTKEDATP